MNSPIRITTLLTFLYLLLFAGCSSGGGNSDSSTSTNPPSLNPKKSAWIYSFESNRTISRFTADGETGRVYTEGHTPSFLTSLPTDIAIAREGEVIYILDALLDNISLFRVNPKSGAIRKEAATPTSNFATQLLTSPKGKFLFAYGANRIFTLAIDPTTDEVTETSSTTLSSIANDILIDPQEQFLYAYDRSAALLEVFRINPTTGELTVVDADPVLGGHQTRRLDNATSEVHMEAGGRFIYAAADVKVVVFKIDRATGILSEDSQELSDENSITTSITSMPDASMLYVGHSFGPIVTYSVDEKTGALERVDANSKLPGVQNTDFGTAPRKLLIGPAGKRLLVFQTNTGLISNFELDPASGTPRNPTTIIDRKGTSVQRVLSANRDTPALRDPNYLYVNGVDGSARIEAFKVDPMNGDLTLVESIATSKTGKLISDRANRFLYTVNSDVEGFRIDHETGLLTDMGILTGPNGSRPLRAVVSPSGWSMFSFSFVNGSSPAFASYNCGLDSSLSPFGNWALSKVGGPDPATFTVGDAAVDPLGKTAYMCNARFIRAYPINARNEVQQRLDSNLITPGFQDYDNGFSVDRIAADPLGRFLYSLKQSDIAAINDGHLSVYRIDDQGAPLLTDADASLAGVNRITFAGTPLDIYVDPSGRFVYISVRIIVGGLGASAIAAFALNEDTGQLAPIDADPSTAAIDYYRNDQNGAGRNLGLAIEPSGRFLYISRPSNGDEILMRYEIHQQTGALENLSTVANTLVTGSLIVTGTF